MYLRMQSAKPSALTGDPVLADGATCRRSDGFADDETFRIGPTRGEIRRTKPGPPARLGVHVRSPSLTLRRAPLILICPAPDPRWPGADAGAGLHDHVRHFLPFPPTWRRAGVSPCTAGFFCGPPLAKSRAVFHLEYMGSRPVNPAKQKRSKTNRNEPERTETNRSGRGWRDPGGNGEKPPQKCRRRQGRPRRRAENPDFIKAYLIPPI